MQREASYIKGCTIINYVIFSMKYFWTKDFRQSEIDFSVARVIGILGKYT